jgi:hypothetical protein
MSDMTRVSCYLVHLAHSKSETSDNMEIESIATTYRALTLLRNKQTSPETEYLFCYGPIVRSLDSSVNIATVYGLDVRSSNPGRAKRLFKKGSAP